MSASHPRPWLSRYAENVPDDVPLPAGSLSGIVDDAIAQYPENVALEFFGRTTTYSQLGEQIAAAAEGLRLLGVKKGDPVAIVLPNCPQHVVAFYAVLRLGAIVVEHNPLYTPRELRHQFEDHGATVAIAWNKVVETIQAFPNDVTVSTIVSVDLTEAMPLRTRLALRLPIRKAKEARAAITTTVRGTTPWSDVVSAKPISHDVVGPTANDVAVIQYTSGTTGYPKGAVLTHLNLGTNAAQSRAWVPTVERGTAIIYGVLPMFHAFGLTLCLTFAMSLGGRLVLFPRFDADLVLTAIAKRPPTFLAAVPPIFAKLTTEAGRRGISLKGIEIGISGAMPLPPEIVDKWEAATGGYLVEGYGLSETSPVLIANPVGPSRLPGAIGVPVPNTDIRIVDPENPVSERPQGEPGELLVRGPQVFRGYWNKPDETAEVFVDDEDGRWFRTGDIATIDEKGFVRVVDRLKELIITGGFNVSPSEVETLLRDAPGVADVAVVGLPNDHSGEDVVAAVVLEDGATLDVEAIRNHAKDSLARYKVPRRIVQVDELPKSLMGKVLRRKVRDQLSAE
ncbi:long-chain-fatty-acid--CoA ligase [Marisediminicola senii]|uniref:long-chain-fatty-acid--CoA ligase n=1 Tax=Marisediminicola senii TaxID=2711233 RepID=UPI0013ED2DAA|nr:long-chain-fatty-acid--CoA ligase [Marisediminicola senii]